MPARALLVHAPKRTEYNPLLGVHGFAELVPMGLFALAAQAARRGHRVELLHLAVERGADPRFSLAERVRRDAIDTVGFSLHWHQQSAAVLAEVHALAAAQPGVRIVLGGATATAFAEELLREHPVHAVCRGEGERCWPELLDRPAGEPLHGVPNLAWRDGEELVLNPGRHAPDSAELDAACFFDPGVVSRVEALAARQACPWIHLQGRRAPLQRVVVSDRGFFPLMTLRGCPHDCGFCAGSRSSQRLLHAREAVAHRSAEAALETAHAAARAGFRSLLMESLAAPAHEAQACAIVEGLARGRPVDKLVLECRDEPGDALLEAMGALRRAGVAARVHLSPDLGSAAGRRRWKSAPIDEPALERVARACARQGLPLRLFLLAGLPSPDHPGGEPLEATAARLARLPAVENVFAHSACLEPGAPMGREPARYGIEPQLHRLADYRALHARPRFPPPLGYAPGGEDPQAFAARVQASLCAHHCPFEGKTSRAGARLVGSAARGACRLRARLPGGPHRTDDAV